ncbi:MAG: hypothetical protein OXI55_14775 [Gammaproteobacteria bacterium]|nr:hypothetical protein [Gammaproteobacteria bacterium]
MIDSSAVINLSNVDALFLLRSLPGREFCVTQTVVDECWPTCGEELAIEIATDGLSVVDDAHIDTARFLDLLDTHSLGRGETESIVACEKLGLALCCDDKRARSLAHKLLGHGRVAGTIAVLRWSVADMIAAPEAAYAMYREMRAKGGFLPDLRQSEFVMPKIHLSRVHGTD